MCWHRPICVPKVPLYSTEIHVEIRRAASVSRVTSKSLPLLLGVSAIPTAMAIAMTTRPTFVAMASVSCRICVRLPLLLGVSAIRMAMAIAMTTRRTFAATACVSCRICAPPPLHLQRAACARMA